MVSAIGSGNAGAFDLYNGDQAIGYTVEWTSGETTASGKSAATSAEFTAALSESDCENGNGSAAFAVAIDPEHLQEVRTGAPYTGILTLIVAPE